MNVAFSPQKFAIHRRAANMTQADFADKLRQIIPDCRVSPQMVSDYETGRRVPTRSRMLLFAKALNIKLEDITQ